jgi:hypothetical protein
VLNNTIIVVTFYSLSYSLEILEVSIYKNLVNITSKRNVQASEMRTFAKTTPLSTTPYNVTTT